MTNTNVKFATNQDGEKLYKRYDLQDEENDFAIETLQEMREWLADFWNENPDEDMTDEEHEERIEAIMQSDEEELFNRLGGIDYSYYELDEDGKEITYPMQEMTTSLCWGYAVKSERVTKPDGSEVAMITLKRGENKSPEVPFEVSIENWEEEHEKYTNQLQDEMREKNKNRPTEIKYLA